MTWLLLFLCCLLVASASAFVWPIQEDLPAGKVFTFSERYMFAEGEGPPMLEQGKAYIDIDLTISMYNKLNETRDISYAIYAISGEGKSTWSLEGLCGSESDIIKENSYWASEIDYATVPHMKYMGYTEVHTPSINGSFYKFQTKIKHYHKVSKTEWHNVVFMLCPSGDDTDGVLQEEDGLNGLIPAPVAMLQGTITFRNPYGFIPGELYGLLPFEGARMVAYVLATCYFLFFYCRHKEAVLPLHNMFLAVFVFALIEATLWYGSYQALNLNGQPYCCPFPPSVIVALLMQVIRQTMARAILLIVCLGYGVVRPKLLSSEWIAIGLVSTFYVAAAIVAQSADIIVVQNIHGDAADDTMYKIPAMFMDVVFLFWIYLAISSTIRILTEFQQTAKLQMYKSLVRIIGFFMVIFAVMTVFVFMDDKKIIDLPWQLTWLQQVLWEALNFAVLFSICIVCKPAENSHLLSYVAQLPTEDPDEDFDEEALGEKFISSGVRSSTRRARDDIDEEEDGGVEGSGSDRGVEMTQRNVIHGQKYNSGLSLHKSTYKTTPAKSLPPPPTSPVQSQAAAVSSEFTSLPDADLEEGDMNADYDISKD